MQFYPPMQETPWRERPGDDLDDLLTAFFRSERPSPWPAAPEPEEADVIARPASLPRRSPWNSRFALAASVALMLAGGWMLSGSFKQLGPEGPAPSLSDGTADRDDGKAFKKVKSSMSLEQQPSGEIGIRIDLHLPDDKDTAREKDIKNQTGLPE
jgi:hypothetical protein